jgi:predicted PurR-regulated permease PerM
MKVKLEIDTRTFVRFWLVVIGFALVALAIFSAKSALLIVGAAFFLALILNPPVSLIAKKLPGKSRVAGTAIAYVAVVLVLGMFVFLVVPPVIQQTAKAIETIPSLVNGATEQYKGLNDFINTYDLRPQVDNALNSIQESSASVARSVGSNLLSGIGSVFSAITATILVLVLGFLMLVEGPRWLKKLWSTYSDKSRRDYHKDVLHRMYTVVTGYATGQLTVSTIAGVVAGFAVFILSFIFNVPSNLAIPTAAIVFLLSLIPMFGAMIGAILVGLVLAFNDVTAAVIFVIFFILYQQLEANYISPRIQSKRIDLSALAILIAVTIGIYLFGIAGGIISIPIAGIIKIIAEEYFARRKRMHGVKSPSDATLTKITKD